VSENELDHDEEAARHDGNYLAMHYIREVRARRAADLTDGDLDLIDSGLAALASDYPDYDRGDGAVRVEALRAKLKEPRRGV
jgi:hypothetical protein